MASSVQKAPVRRETCGAFTYAIKPGTDRKSQFTCRLQPDHSPSNIHRDGIMFYWDDKDTETSFPSGIPQLCGICGKSTPSHVAVRDGDNLVADRLCGSHTLAEIVLSGKYALQVSVIHE